LRSREGHCPRKRFPCWEKKPSTGGSAGKKNLPRLKKKRGNQIKEKGFEENPNLGGGKRAISQGARGQTTHDVEGKRGLTPAGKAQNKHLKKKKDEGGRKTLHNAGQSYSERKGRKTR